MHPTDTCKPWPRLLLVLFLGWVLSAAPVAAEDKATEGEPTDPEGAYLVLGGVGIDLGDQGVAAPPETGTADYDSWYEALVELLRSLGLLPAEGTDR